MSKLIGVQDATGRFACADHAKEAGIDPENEKNTPVFDDDEWFDGEICCVGEHLVEGWAERHA